MVKHDVATRECSSIEPLQEHASKLMVGLPATVSIEPAEGSRELVAELLANEIAPRKKLLIVELGVTNELVGHVADSTSLLAATIAPIPLVVAAPSAFDGSFGNVVLRHD